VHNSIIDYTDLICVHGVALISVLTFIEEIQSRM